MNLKTWNQVLHQYCVNSFARIAVWYKTAV